MTGANREITLAEIEQEAWRIGDHGDRSKIIAFSSRSYLHSQIMSGNLKLNGRPKSKPGVPLIWMRSK